MRSASDIFLLKVHSCRYQNLAIHSSSYKHSITQIAHYNMFHFLKIQTTKYFLRKIKSLRVNNSRILKIQNAKILGHYFYMNTNIWRNFPICISASLNFLNLNPKSFTKDFKILKLYCTSKANTQ